MMRLVMTTNNVQEHTEIPVKSTNEALLKTWEHFSQEINVVHARDGLTLPAFMLDGWGILWYVTLEDK